jgi:predicted ester cyclase
MSVEDNKRILSELVDGLINRKDYSVVDRLVAPDVVSHDPFPGQPPGSAGLISTFRIFHEAFPDLHTTIEEMLGEGDRVAGRLTVRGTHKGEFLGQQATGNPIEYAEIIILRIAAGRIVEHRAVADTTGLMAAISGEPDPEG